MFQNKIAYGSNGFPWTHSNARRDINYKKGICPLAEKLHDETFLGIEICLHEYSRKNIQELILAFKKVFNNLHKI
jgi:hypothetical protein